MKAHAVGTGETVDRKTGELSLRFDTRKSKAQSFEAFDKGHSVNTNYNFVNHYAIIIILIIGLQS